MRPLPDGFTGIAARRWHGKASMKPASSGRTDLSPRQRQILEQARREGEVLVDLLAHRFEVTAQTIRRDLGQLCSLRLLRRTHGGATASDGVSNLGYAARQQLAARHKAAIGRHAASLIPNDSSLFVNIGTTTEEVARHLTTHAGLLVITNNVNVVNLLRDCPNIRLMIAGGRVRREDGGVVGDQAVDFFQQFRVDYAVIGVSAIEEDGTLLDFDASEVRVARTIIDNARAVILVADGTKFERSAPVRIGHIAQVDVLVTDDAVPDLFLDVCEGHGVRVETAAPAQEARHGS